MQGSVCLSPQALDHLHRQLLGQAGGLSLVPDLAGGWLCSAWCMSYIKARFGLELELKEDQVSSRVGAKGKPCFFFFFRVGARESLGSVWSLAGARKARFIPYLRLAEGFV